MVKKILAVFVAVAFLSAIFVASRPSTYKIERSIVVNAPVEALYPEVVSFRKWSSWSPWAKLDPKMVVDYAGPDAGTGSVYHWKGNEKVGEGRMTITGARENDLVQIKLEFLKPWEQTSETTFKFTREPDDHARVTWTMTGQHDWVGKLFALFVDMDKMVGGDFEKGLAKLKRATEE